MQAHKYNVGTEYKTRGKHPRLCIVSDLMTLTNSKGETVKTFYKSEHSFLGQTITDHEVVETTIARGLITSKLL